MGKPEYGLGKTRTSHSPFANSSTSRREKLVHIVNFWFTPRKNVENGRFLPEGTAAAWKLRADGTGTTGSLVVGRIFSAAVSKHALSPVEGGAIPLELQSWPQTRAAKAKFRRTLESISNDSAVLAWSDPIQPLTCRPHSARKSRLTRQNFDCTLSRSATIAQR